MLILQYIFQKKRIHSAKLYTKLSKGYFTLIMLKGFTVYAKCNLNYTQRKVRLSLSRFSRNSQKKTAAFEGLRADFETIVQ